MVEFGKCQKCQKPTDFTFSPVKNGSKRILDGAYEIIKSLKQLVGFSHMLTFFMDAF